MILEKELSPVLKTMVSDYHLMADNMDSLANRLSEIHDSVHFLYPTKSQHISTLVGAMRHDAHCYRKEARRLAGLNPSTRTGCATVYWELAAEVTD